MSEPVAKALVSGKFRVIHSGHIRLFRLAKELADELVVALDVATLDSDDIAWRLQALRNIDFVSRVITYEGDIDALLQAERPNIVVKGSEFAQVHNSEEDSLDGWGGRLIFSSGDVFFSERDMILSENEELLSKAFPLPHGFMQRHNISKDRLQEIIGNFGKIGVCVIGDLIVDEFINCHPLGMSQEEPTVVVTPIDRKRFIGGAGIVAAHCSLLGAQTTLLTICGDDEVGEWSKKKIAEYGIHMIAPIDSTRPTTLKQRFRSGSQTLLKLTHLRKDDLSADLESTLISNFEKCIENADVVIFSDFSYGVLTKKLVTEALRLSKSRGVFISADSQSSSQIGDLSRFKDVDLITSTEREARLELKDETNGLVVIVEKLRSILTAKNILLKLGGDGVIIHGTNIEGNLLSTDQVPALNNFLVDTSGAGDSLLAAASLSLASEATIYEATLLGSVVAAIQVGRIGNTPVTSSQVMALLYT